MEWRIEDDSTTATKEYLSCSTIQPAISGPPGTLQDAVHDFSAKYTTPAPAGTFEPPAGVECKPKTPVHPFVPDTSCAPECASGSLCCRDPDVAPPGACYGVSDCSQIHSVAISDPYAYDAPAVEFADSARA